MTHAVSDRSTHQQLTKLSGETISYTSAQQFLSLSEGKKTPTVPQRKVMNNYMAIHFDIPGGNSSDNKPTSTETKQQLQLLEALLNINTGDKGLKLNTISAIMDTLVSETQWSSKSELDGLKALNQIVNQQGQVLLDDVRRGTSDHQELMDRFHSFLSITSHLEAQFKTLHKPEHWNTQQNANNSIREQIGKDIGWRKSYLNDIGYQLLIIEYVKSADDIVNENYPEPINASRLTRFMSQLNKKIEQFISDIPKQASTEQYEELQKQRDHYLTQEEIIKQSASRIKDWNQKNIGYDLENLLTGASAKYKAYKDNIAEIDHQLRNIELLDAVNIKNNNLTFNQIQSARDLVTPSNSSDKNLDILDHFIEQTFKVADQHTQDILKEAKTDNYHKNPNNHQRLFSKLAYIVNKDLIIQSAFNNIEAWFPMIKNTEKYKGISEKYQFNKPLRDFYRVLNDHLALFN